MGKVKEYYKEQIDNDDYYFPPDVEYHMTYGGKYGRWIPKIYNWFNKKYASPKNAKPVYIKAEKVEYPF